MKEKDLVTLERGEQTILQEAKDKDQAKLMAEANREHRNTMPYVTASTSCIPIGAVVPTKLAWETTQALAKFINSGEDTTDFVQKKLGYNSRLAVCEAFASEQVDALALAIVQMENNKGFILGDMAGIGKGRVVAGMLRYAYQNKKIPVFLTISPSLFSDIYRDIFDIGGFDSSAPLHSIKNLPTPFIFNEDGIVKRTEGEDEITLFEPDKTKRTIELCLNNKGKLPKNTNLVMLTYSQLAKDIDEPKNHNAISKFEYLQSIAPNAIFVLDESHKGSGEGNIGKNIYSLLSYVKGVMFASATYAKVPKSMMLYIPKTDIVDSNIRPDTIVEAVAENGEAVQEYIASLLVKSGQMIRRERTFDKCEIGYRYMPKELKGKYYAIYDQVMSLYNEIEFFAKSTLYKDAVSKAVQRIAKEENIVVYDEKIHGEEPYDREEKKKWQEQHKNKYRYSFPTANTITSRFQWIENLLFAIKASYVANETIGYMNKRKDVEYTENNKSSIKITNFKPVIAVRNTAEASLATLGYKVGDIISAEQNDYAKTLINVIESLTSAKLTFTPINPSKKVIILEKEEAQIKAEDYADGGERYKEILEKMKNASSGTGEDRLPLSPIDHIINKIQSTKREAWDNEFSSRSTYAVEEITKRKLGIIPHGNDFKVVSLEAENKAKYGDRTITADRVARFNRGETDVILINTAGSTGLSMHSKSDFVDRRPRVMVIHQVELDVATEVQKRGRINRTGQVNNPAYTYVVSIIPSEVRKLLMLRRKLRSLDANTTGNVKQSAKASQILDADGNEIEDMTNKYGYSALNDFRHEAGNEYYDTLMEEKWWDRTSSPETKLEQYLREIEKVPCEQQEDFYNRMNAYYISFKKRMEEADEWDLETSVEDLKSSTWNKKVLFEGNNSNEFTKSVYIEDKYVTPKGKPMTKTEVIELMEEMNDGKDYNAYYNAILDDFKEYTERKVEETRLNLGAPKTENAKDAEEKAKIEQEHADWVEAQTQSVRFKLGEVERSLIFFKPNKVIQIPTETDRLVSGATDAGGERISIVPAIGKVIGFKFLGKSEAKYSPMNIEVHVASPSRLKPYLKFTLTQQYKGIIDWIKLGRVGQVEVNMANEWKVSNPNERDKMRVMTGELFKGIEIAEHLFTEDANYQRKRRLIRFTTTSGTVETGIKLWQKKFISLTEGKTPVITAINNEQIIEMLKDYTEGWQYWLPSKKEFIERNGKIFTLGICTGLYKTQKGEERKNVDKNYLSDYAVSSVIESIKNAFGVNYSLDKKDLYMFASGNQVYLYGVNFIQFKFDVKDLKKWLDYIYVNWKVMVEETGGDDKFLIRDVADTYESGVVEEVEGEYLYYPQLKFDAQSPPPNYVENSYKADKDNANGIITLRYPLSVAEGAVYKMIPANITEPQAVVNIFNLIGDADKRAEYIKEVKALGDDYFEIFLLTQKYIGVIPYYAIGLVNEDKAGEIIARNIDNPIPTDTSKKVEVVPIEERTKPKIPLDWKTAQDFIIQLKSI